MTGVSLRPRKLWKYLLFVFLLGLLALAGLSWYATTNSFQAMVRRRLVAQLERITGGRVELGSFHTTPFRLRVEVRDLTIHGREQPGEIPYAHVERVVAQVKVISILGFEFGFHSLVLDHPVVHIVVYPDGTTNQPPPVVKMETAKTPAERLFALSIGQLEVRGGELLWNDQVVPVDFTANDVSAEMTYSILHQRYFGNFLLGKIVSQYRDYRPMAWMAEAHFSLGPDSIDFGSLKLNSGRSHIEASGSLKHFRQPNIDANYHAKLDIAEFAAIARRGEARGDTAEAQGHATWSLHDFSAAGKLFLKDFSWRDRSIDLQNVTATSQFSITPQRITLTQLDARALGGSVSGSVEVVDWREAPATGKEAKRSQEQKGTAQLRVREVSAGGFADSIASIFPPFHKMNLAGVTSGTIDMRWRGSPKNADAVLALDVAAPSSSSPGQLPLNGHMRATYHGENGELEVADFYAATRASRVQAAGTLARNGALKLSVSTSDLAEWQPILAAFGWAEKIPAILHGHAAFNGTVAGIMPNVTFAGELQAQDFDYLLPANAQAGAQTIHWDSFDANLQLSSRMLILRNGILQHAGTRLNFGWASELGHWQFSNQGSLNARLAVHNGALAEILSLAGYNFPATGTMSLYLQASGTLDKPQASGRVQLNDVTVRGETFQTFDAALRVDGQRFELNHIDLAYGAARVSGATDYDFSSSQFHLDLGGSNFDLSKLTAGRTGRVQLGGQLDFTAHGSGLFGAPAINTTLHLRDLSIDHQRQGDFTLQAVTQGQQLHLTGRSQFEPGAELTVDGDVQLRDALPSTITLRFTHLNLDFPLHPYLQSRLTGPSVATGQLLVQGPLRRPLEMSLTGSLTDLAVDVENMKLHNQGPIEFAVSAHTLQLKSFHMLGEGTDFSADGTVQLGGDQALNVRARGQGNLKLLESFDSAFTSSGTVNADTEVGGTFSKPVIHGRLQVTNGAINYVDLPAGFSGINGSVTLDQNRMQIDNLTAHTGGGLVTFGGSVAWINHQLNFDVNLQEQDVRLRYPPGISSTANADLHFAGSSSGSTLSGDITVTKLSVMPGFDFGAYLARSSRSTALPVTNPTLNRIRLDVHVMTTPELQMQTAVVRLSGDADLRLRGSAAKPVLMGRAEVLEGEVSFNGTKYELERGEVTFQNPITTTPELDLQATTHVRDYDITLSLNGAPDKLRLTYRSEPPLPEADIITLLALGRTTTESAQLQESGQSSFTQEASSAIISQALNATVTNRAQRLFGVSRIKIDPEGLTSETTLGRGPSVTIEQQVADNLAITYSTSVEQASQQIIQVVYNLPRNISIVATRDQDGVVSFDLKIRRRKK